MSQCPAKPLQRIGLIADVQYVDDDDAFNYRKTRRRYYRSSLDRFRAAVDHWREEKIERVIQLGDLLDGKSSSQGKKDSDFAQLERVISGLPVPWHHCIGNHELYNFTEKELRAWMSRDSRIELKDANFYAFSPAPGFLVVVLNSYEINYANQKDANENGDVSLLVRNAEARRLLDANNPNDNKNSPTGLVDFDRRWVAFNGGLGKHQLQWFESQLSSAKSKREKVLVVSHVPIEPKACADILDLAWDYEGAQNVISRFGDVVVGVFAGHDHDGNSYLDEAANILYVTFKAVLETEPGSNAFAICDLFDDRIVFKGFGKIPTYVVQF